MKTFGLLVVAVCVVVILVGSTSYAAPACCDPAQAQNVIKPSKPASEVGIRSMPGVATPKPAPRANQLDPVLPQVAYGALTQAKLPVAQAAAQLNSVYRPVSGPVASPGRGCCGDSKMAPVPTVARGCGGACASCRSRANADREQVRSSAQPSVPACCGGRGINPAPPVQTRFSPKSYVQAAPVYAPIKQGPRAPTALTANSGPGRPQGQVFGSLW
jgi:hypothetical protein